MYGSVSNILKIMKCKTSPVLSFAALILFCAACSDSFLETGNGPIIDIPETSIIDMEKAFSELPFKTGTNDFELDASFTQKWQFRVIVPEMTGNEPLPLFVNLHGGALTRDPDAHKRTGCLIEPALENTKAYVISPNSRGLLWYEPVNESMVVDLVNFALKNLNIDPNKVVVVGYSDGGNGSWFLSDTHPEIFSAGIPMASAYGLSYTDGILNKTEIPLYVIHGEFDELFPFTNTETAVELSTNAGSEIVFVKAVGLSHTVPCEYLPYLLDAIDWLETSVWQ